MRRLRGSVLVQVLMTAVIVSIIAAGMMQLLLMRSQSIKRDEERITGTARTHGGIIAIYSGWAAFPNNGDNCSTVPGYTGGGGALVGTCNCTYTANDGTGTIITATSSASHCELKVNATPAL